MNIASPGVSMSYHRSLSSPSVQRKIWWILVRATGPAGHGSRFVQGTAVEKLMRMANKVLAFREEQAAELAASCGCGKQLGDFTTMNLTMVSGSAVSFRSCLAPSHATDRAVLRLAVSLQLKAGSLDQHQFNVIPTVAEAGFDCRIPATVDLVAFRRRLDEWCAADPGVTYELVAGSETRATEHAVSDISEGSYWWSIFQAACKKVSRAVMCFDLRHYLLPLSLSLSLLRLAWNCTHRPSFLQRQTPGGFVSSSARPALGSAPFVARRSSCTITTSTSLSRSSLRAFKRSRRCCRLWQTHPPSRCRLRLVARERD